jgi:arylsulfatase A-like enzyme
MMGGSTPNIDRIADEGMLFVDHYGQASCTAGRAAFITGQFPLIERWARLDNLLSSVRKNHSVGSDLRRWTSVCPWQDSNLQPAV